MASKVFDTLVSLGLTSDQTSVLFNKGTRDVDEVEVWKDSRSGVIFIKDFYVGDSEYARGDYRADELSDPTIGRRDLEVVCDAERRVKECLRFVAGKRILDFGCGAGDFLKLVRPYCEDVLGVELQKSFITSLEREGVRCVEDVAEVEDHSLDVIVSFHVIEHLPDPLEVLSVLRKKLRPGGVILIEVPNANDFLLATCRNEYFKRFTLWSQHLILHTKGSLSAFLSEVGFVDVAVKGIQRYPLSNHLNWLINDEPGGHKSPLSFFDTAELASAYEAALGNVGQTDTLLAIAKVK